MLTTVQPSATVTFPVLSALDRFRAPAASPLIASIMRLMMFIGLVSVLFAFCLHWLVHEPDAAKKETTTASVGLTSAAK
jgi:hypothetical protein